MGIRRCLRTPLLFAGAYLLVATAIFLWFASSVGKSESAGLLAGLVMAIATLPGLLFSHDIGSSLVAFFDCSWQSPCGNLIGFGVAAGLTAICLFALAYGYCWISQPEERDHSDHP
jgi:hypothetical protein